MNFEQAAEAALKNIARHGDTDIFPLPFETHIFYDRLRESRARLEEIHNDFERRLASRPPFTIATLTQVGYTGFRWAMQIEPFWNAYYLALVISIAEQIEAKRIPATAGVIFSYRYGWNEAEAKLFSDSNWRDYKRRAIDLSREAEFVVTTDIAEFYPRIYHHRLENALRRLPSAGDTPARIMRLLSHFSQNVSYGLPIGGPASRILAELALTPVDDHLHRRKITFCRYADDYTIFCNSKSDAYKVLVLLSEKLFNEGLVLQKAKTRIVTGKEFREASSMLDPESGSGGSPETDEQKLLRINIRFDPYSQNPEDDYERLKAAVEEVDIVGILGREVAKTAIDPVVTKQAINAIRALRPFAREGALRTLLDPQNIVILAPVFVSLMRTVRGVYPELDEAGQSFVDEALVQLYDTRTHVLSVDLNLCYFVRALSPKLSARKEEILIEIFENRSSALIRRHIILTMAKWRCFYWLTDIRQRYSGLSEWEKRAVILASYVLGDEGRHWRDYTKHTWDSTDALVRDWFAARWQQTPDIPA